MYLPPTGMCISNYQKYSKPKRAGNQKTHDTRCVSYPGVCKDEAEAIRCKYHHISLFKFYIIIKINNYHLTWTKKSSWEHDWSNTKKEKSRSIIVSRSLKKTKEKENAKIKSMEQRKLKTGEISLRKSLPKTTPEYTKIAYTLFQNKDPTWTQAFSKAKRIDLCSQRHERGIRVSTLSHNRRPIWKKGLPH